MKKFLCYDTNDAASGKINVDNRGMLKPVDILTFTGAVTGTYNGSAPLSVKIPSAVTDDHINSLIDTKLGVIENGSY